MNKHDKNKNDINLNLYDWQKDCLIKWFVNDCRGIIDVATGAGKTVLAIAAIKSLEEKLHKNESNRPLKVKIIVPKIFLAGQWLNALIDMLGVKRHEIGLYYGQIKENENRRYMIYVLNSARYSVSSHIVNDCNNNYNVMLICDECHHFGSAENSKVFDFFPYIKSDRYFSLGLSATPDLNNPVLVRCLGGEIYKYGFDKAVKMGVVADYNVFNVSLDFRDNESEEYAELTDRLKTLLPKIMKIRPYLKKYKDDRFYAELKKLAAAKIEKVSELASAILITLYKRKEIVYLAQNRIFCAEELIKRLPDNRIIVFAERISTVDELYGRLKKSGSNIRVGKYHSEMGSQARKLALERYMTGEINVLLSCRALDEGLNVPETDTGIIMSSTGSVRQRIQRAGRVLRKSGGKSAKSIYYLYIGGYLDYVEESEAIPNYNNANQNGAFNLRYGFTENGCAAFTNEEYDLLCRTAINRLIKNKTPPMILDEVKNNFRLGIVRSDWRFSESECRSKIEKSKSASEKNYWISMLKLAFAKNKINQIQ